MSGRAPLSVVLAAGGTGGHLYPAQALTAVLQARGVSVALITDQRGAGIGGLPEGLPVHRIRSAAMVGTSLAARVPGAFDMSIGVFQARSLLKRIRPRVVVGFGGYAAAPTMVAATFGGYHTLIHEQNAVLGRANRLLAARVEKIACTFNGGTILPSDPAKVIVTGMPVRPAFLAVRGIPYRVPAADGPIRILVIGGSQGAQVFAEVIPEAIALLDDDIRRRLVISQQCRPENQDSVAAAYRRLGVAATTSAFFDDVSRRLAEAHLLIARAGASTVAELTTVGRPAILVPYPYAADDHQTANARAVESVGAAWVIPQPEFSPDSLSRRVSALVAIPETLKQAASAAYAAGHPEAAVRLADAVFRLARSNGADGRSPRGRAAA